MTTEPQAIPSTAEEHRPYVADDVTMPEFTTSAVLVGVIFGLVFGASSLYLVLKVGLTVSASIPAAVLAVTLFRAISRALGMRRATILENNIVQTTASAGESIAFGVGVTMPALMLLGFDMSVERVMVVASLGGLLGILMMIPLRRAFVVKLHGKAGEPGKLLYPEGTACAQVLITGEKGGSSGATVFGGFVIAFVYQMLCEGAGLLRLKAQYSLSFFSRVGELSTLMSPELLGVGYIIGPRTSAIMMAGGVLGSLVILPTIVFFGDQLTVPIPPATKLIRDMRLGDLKDAYLNFIGAGCVAAAGIISMFRTLPMIFQSLVQGVVSLRGGSDAPESAGKRTDRDMPISIIVLGCFGLVAVLSWFLAQEFTPVVAVFGSLLVLAFGFLFVTVSSRLTGEIGSSSNPISGMTVATLTLTCLIFLSLGMTSPIDQVLALSIGAVVCVAASNGGTTSQDLKTGFLVGATPIRQQQAILIGAFTSALVIGGMLLLFNAAGTVYSAKNLPTINLKSEVPNLTQKEAHEGKTYHVWRPSKERYPDVTPGKYLVDDDGSIRYFVDPAIAGKLNVRDDGTEVKMKFDAPKTQVMAVIIKGVLKRELNWGLVLIGAMIAVTLELCGVSSLAFAVGVYIPMAYSVPIFVGGIARWLVDVFTAPAKGESDADSIARSESSPGMLLSSGYIAGGSLAGVTIAFLEFDFASKIKEKMNWKSGDLPYNNENGVALAAFGALIIVLLVAGIFLARRPAAAEPKE